MSDYKTGMEVIEALNSGEHNLVLNATELTEQAKRAEVTDLDTAAKAADFIKVVRSFITTAEEERKRYTGPLNAVVTELNAAFRQVRAPMEEALDTMKGKLDAYMAAQEAAPAHTPDDDVPISGSSVPTMAPRGELTGARVLQRHNWKYRVRAIRKVPAAYLLVNDQMIRAAIEATRTAARREGEDRGLKGKGLTAFINQTVKESLELNPIPGLEFYLESQNVVR